MKSRWVLHSGKRVFIADFSHYGDDAAAIRAECGAIKEALGKEIPGSVRSVTSVEGTSSNPDVLKALAELLPFSNKYIRLRALVGVSGFRKYFLDSFTNLTGNVNFMTFDTLPQALDWITQDLTGSRTI